MCSGISVSSLLVGAQKKYGQAVAIITTGSALVLIIGGASQRRESASAQVMCQAIRVAHFRPSELPHALWPGVYIIYLTRLHMARREVVLAQLKSLGGAQNKSSIEALKRAFVHFDRDKVIGIHIRCASASQSTETPVHILNVCAPPCTAFQSGDLNMREIKILMKALFPTHTRERIDSLVQGQGWNRTSRITFDDMIEALRYWAPVMVEEAKDVRDHLIENHTRFQCFPD
jgi:hypothetical protein